MSAFIASSWARMQIQATVCHNQQQYPLPLISSAFEPLQGATIFGKLDLPNTYHLSQRFGPDQKLHPWAFFSHLLSPAERNYDGGNCELLSIKMALDEWRHWLEGNAIPFVVWTDHKNLAYIQSAKRLNSRQAHWALFFGRLPHRLQER